MKRGVFTIILLFTCLIGSIIMSVNTSSAIDGDIDGDTEGEIGGQESAQRRVVKCTKQEADAANKKAGYEKYYAAFSVVNKGFCQDNRANSSDKKKYGGISWHIFEVKDIDKSKKYKINNNVGASDQEERAKRINKEKSIATRSDAMEKELKDMAEECRATNYFAAYVYDGWWNNTAIKDAKAKSIGIHTSIKPVYYGPLEWKTFVAEGNKGSGLKDVYPIYNNNLPQKTSADIKKIIDNGGTINDAPQLKGDCTKINNNKECKKGTYASTAADNLHKLWQGNAVPDGVGAFCLPAHGSFKGRSSVKPSGGAYTHAGWIGGTISKKNNNLDNEKTETIKVDCPATGCEVWFRHNIKRRDDPIKSKSAYTISELVYEGVKKTSEKTLKTGNSSGNDGNGNSQKVREAKRDLKPGMMICETLTFDHGSLKNEVKNFKTTVCAIGMDSGSSEALIDIKVRNNDAFNYSQFTKEVYAKPGDNLFYRSYYNPFPQLQANKKYKKIKINGSKVFGDSDGIKLSTGGRRTLKNFFDYRMAIHRSQGETWRNWYNAFTVDRTFGTTLTYSYQNGDGAKKEPENNYQVKVSDAGKDLSETAAVNKHHHASNTPVAVNIDYKDNNFIAQILTTPHKEATASAKVPYNYENRTEISNNNKNYLYAGEKATINYTYTIGRKRNYATAKMSGTYAYYVTKVDNTKTKLKVCINGTENCYDAAVQNLGTVTPSNPLADMTTTRTVDFNVPDVPAGTRVCLVSVISPANSGDDRNWQNADGYGEATSSPKCFTVAKKPSIQIWGGNIYSAGGLAATPATKYVLAGYDNYNPTHTNSTSYIFGSFAELGLIAGGKVTGFASGAGTGYAKNDNGSLWPNPHPANGSGNNSPNANTPNPGGGRNTNFCTRSTLSFANDKCITGSVGDLGSSNDSNITKAKNDKESIIEKLAVQSGDDKYEISGNYSLDDEPSEFRDTHKTPNGSYYYYSSSDLTFAGGTLQKDTTQMIHSKGNITITGNTSYSGTYQKLANIPNLIIYAEGGITINCSVTQLNALIIANGEVKTCHSDNINAEENSNQLRINGAVVAGKLTANRTYGAATGNNSIIPAEIINFNPALYLWNATNTDGSNKEDKNEIKDLDTVYLTEVAPRY